MDRPVGHRIQLHLARQHPEGVGAELQIVEPIEEAGAMQLAHEHAVLEADQNGVFVIAIDDAGNPAGPTDRPGGPLSAPVAPFGGDVCNLNHETLSFLPTTWLVTQPLVRSGLQGCRHRVLEPSS